MVGLEFLSDQLLRRVGQHIAMFLERVVAGGELNEFLEITTVFLKASLLLHLLVAQKALLLDSLFVIG